MSTANNPITTGWAILASGNLAVVQPNGDVSVIIPVVDLVAIDDDSDGFYDEGPSCMVCDGLGHGYPGGGPCPLEVGGYEFELQDHMERQVARYERENL